MRGGLKAREARLAFWMLLPTFSIVIAIVILPVIANFWIAFKPIQLGDLRPPKPAVRESVRAQPKAAGEVLEVRYRIQNRTDNPITWARFTDELAPGLRPVELPDACHVAGALLTCELPGGLAPKKTVNLEVRFVAGSDYFAAGAPYPRDSRPRVESRAPNPILSKPFTVQNFASVLTDPDFWPMLKVTLAYTVFGTVLSILLGLFAAQLLSPPFAGRQVLRGLFLFPYVAPVIAVAFTWVFLLDPFAGTINA
ncbi:MAG TPA: sugar ABC transporter permease, partial [Oceanithermus profundus]|nr:sugar ABC transporter permease [Oceanithermus profundus]